jgi:hypothetical protein
MTTLDISRQTTAHLAHVWSCATSLRSRWPSRELRGGCVSGGDGSWSRSRRERAPIRLLTSRLEERHIRAGRHYAAFPVNVRLHPHSVSAAIAFESADCAIGTEYPQLKQASLRLRKCPRPRCRPIDNTAAMGRWWHSPSAMFQTLQLRHGNKSWGMTRPPSRPAVAVGPRWQWVSPGFGRREDCILHQVGSVLPLQLDRDGRTSQVGPPTCRH